MTDPSAGQQGAKDSAVVSLPLVGEADYKVPGGQIGPAELTAGRERSRIYYAAWMLVGILVYIGLGLLAILPVLQGGITHTIRCGGCNDIGQQVWFLEWSAKALTHLHNPLRTNYINYPTGVDLADQTSMPLAGILAAPITLSAGPVASFNVLLVFSFAASATAAMFAFRRWVASRFACFLGGLLYGFCPYLIGNAASHVFLQFAAIPPLILLALDEILCRQQRRWYWMGLLLALLLIVELGWSAEIFADCCVVALIGVVTLAIVRRDAIRSRLPYAARALALAALAGGPVALAYAVTIRTGPQHISGSLQPVNLLTHLSSDLAGPFMPTVLQRYTLGLGRQGNSWVANLSLTGVPRPNAGENGTYIGIPLLVLLGLGTWKYHRDRLVQFTMFMAAAAFVMSLGSRLHVFGHYTPVPLPFVVLKHLPFLDSSSASRYTMFMWLFVALAATAILDRWVFARRHSDSRRRSLTAQLAPRAVPVALLGASLVALVPNWPYSINPSQVPQWFSSPAVDSIAAGSTLLTYPVATNGHNLPMFWQAVDGMRWRSPSGEYKVGHLHTGPVWVAENFCWNHPAAVQPPRGYQKRAVAELQLWQVRTIVVPTAFSVNPTCAIRYFQQVLRAPPDWQYGAAVWRLG